VVMTGAASVEWYQTHPTHGFQVFPWFPGVSMVSRCLMPFHVLRSGPLLWACPPLDCVETIKCDLTR
jgi:hypothetical protein